jgi:cysteine desulfurase
VVPRTTASSGHLIFLLESRVFRARRDRFRVLPLLYADYNATTPLDPEVRAAMAEALDGGFGNPSSLHQVGQQARRLIERARGQVAALVGAEPDEIVFTSGGTESDNLAVLGAMGAAPSGRRSLVTTTIEHHAVLDPCVHLRAAGTRVAMVGVDGEGRLKLDALAAAIGPETALVSVMLANNDTGAIQPVAEVARIARATGALVHTDAVQAAGKLQVAVDALGVSMLSLSSHKLHGPKGAGALYVRREVVLRPLMHGGHQERSLRPGTENVPAIVGFGKACELARARLSSDAAQIRKLRDRFEGEILARVQKTRVNGPRGPEARLANTSNISFAGADAEALTINLDLLGMAASRGSACSAGDPAPSHVLLAMGQATSQARSAVRFSFGRETTVEEIDRAVGLVVQAVGLLLGAKA